MVGRWPGLAGALYGATMCSATIPRLDGGSMIPNNWALTCWYSSPGSGEGAFMLIAVPYGTGPGAVPGAAAAAQPGTGLERPSPATPANEATSPGSYRRPSRLSKERFSNM